MDWLNHLTSLLRDPNAWWVLSGTTLLGLTCGVLGCFAFLRKRGLMGDVLAHAALPGICLAFMLTAPNILSGFCWAPPPPACWLPRPSAGSPAFRGSRRMRPWAWY